MVRVLALINGIRLAGGAQVPIEQVDKLLLELIRVQKECLQLQQDLREINSILVSGIPECVAGNFPRQTARIAVDAYGGLRQGKS